MQAHSINDYLAQLNQAYPRSPLTPHLSTDQSFVQPPQVPETRPATTTNQEVRRKKTKKRATATPPNESDDILLLKLLRTKMKKSNDPEVESAIEVLLNK